MANPIVKIEMENGGVITAELYPDDAPQYRAITLSSWPHRAFMTA